MVYGDLGDHFPQRRGYQYPTCEGFEGHTEDRVVHAASASPRCSHPFFQPAALRQVESDESHCDGKQENERVGKKAGKAKYDGERNVVASGALEHGGERRTKSLDRAKIAPSPIERSR